MGLSNPEHGTYEMFKEGKCRCEPCRASSKERRRLIKLEYNRRRRKENPEIHRAAVCSWRERNREKSVAQARKWNVENRERYNANMKSWRERNKEKVAEQNRKQREKNPEARKVNDHKRRALKLENGVFEMSKRDWNRLVARYDYCCAYCREHKDLTMDHVIPLSRGGRHSIGNIVPACRSCNSKKHSKFIVEWKAA